MKKFRLFPDFHLPKAVGNALAYLVMGFGLLVLVTGIVVKDEMPAVAQNAQTQEVVDNRGVQTGAAIDSAQDSTGVADNNNENLAVIGDSATNGDQTEKLPAAVEASPSEVSDQTQNDLAAEHVIAAPSQAMPNANSSVDPASYYKDPSHAKAGTQILIEKKKAEDNTSIFSRLMSVVGIFAFLGIAYAMSNNRKKILWKLVIVGTLLQLVFAVFILWTPIGKAIFAGLNDAVSVLLDFTKAGTKFLFANNKSGSIESANLNTAMSILPPIIFFSSLMTMLYHLGIMQWIVKGMASFMMKFMGTSGSETLSSVSNIFVGMTEAPLVVKPYVASMTKSELFSVMTGGFATVAGGVMASYVATLQPFFPDIAGHLIAASVMSAPATLVVAKIIYPETEESETRGKYKLDKLAKDSNVIDAAARGASEGMQLAINVAAMLLAFISIIALINFVLAFPSRVYNANTYDHVANYAVSAGIELDPNCQHPYSTSDTLACTHGVLVKIASNKDIALEQSLTELASDQSTQVQQIEDIYKAVIPSLNSPIETTPMYADCRDNHNIAACGAVAATMQNESWVPELKEKGVIGSLSLEVILGWVFFPFAFLMGVPFNDCFLVGQLLGEKMGLNEFVAYLHLSHVLDQLSYRSIVISTYALCGFANFGSIAIQIGGIGGMAPNRRSEIAKFGIKAMIAGSIAAFMTATIAGALI